jgi:membrane protein required for beta-lactamase induction
VVIGLFSLISNFTSLILWVVIGVPIVLLLLYFLALVGHNFFGGPLWLWVTIVGVLGFSCIIEEYNKFKAKKERQPQ